MAAQAMTCPSFCSTPSERVYIPRFNGRQGLSDQHGRICGTRQRRRTESGQRLCPQRGIRVERAHCPDRPLPPGLRKGRCRAGLSAGPGGSIRSRQDKLVVLRTSAIPRCEPHSGDLRVANPSYRCESEGILAKNDPEDTALPGRIGLRAK